MFIGLYGHGTLTITKGCPVYPLQCIYSMEQRHPRHCLYSTEQRQGRAGTAHGRLGTPPLARKLAPMSRFRRSPAAARSRGRSRRLSRRRSRRRSGVLGPPSSIARRRSCYKVQSCFYWHSACFRSATSRPISAPPRPTGNRPGRALSTSRARKVESTESVLRGAPSRFADPSGPRETRPVNCAIGNTTPPLRTFSLR